MLKQLFTYSILLFPISIFSQVKISEHLDIKDGLSNNYIMDIIQDKQGFIWIATESGLNRFDGRNFTVFTKKNSDLVSNELNTMLYDKDENSIWIGSQRDGISIFNCTSKTFKNHTMDNGLITNDVTDLSKAADGGIWITHYHVGVEYYNKKTKKFTLFADKEIKGMKSQNWCSADDGNGNLYVGHAYDGLSIIDIKNKTSRNIRHNPFAPKGLPGNNVHAIYIDSKKNIWVGTEGGLALFNPKTEDFITFKHDPLNPTSLGADYVYNIKEMKDGTLWISTYMSGISILKLNSITLTNPKKIAFQNIASTQENNSLSSSNIKCLFQDSFNNIWIGNYKTGIDFISYKSPSFNFVSYFSDNNRTLDKKQTWNTYIDPNLNIWIGSKDKIIKFQNNKSLKTINLRQHLVGESSVYVNKIKSDKNGILWIGTTNTDILQLDPKTDKIVRLPFNKKNGYIEEFYQDLNNKMWIGTDQGLFSYHDKKFDSEDHINDQLTDKTIYSILLDKQGKLWIGTFGKGIYIFNKNKKLIFHIEKSNGFCSNAINNLYPDSKGGIWCATRNGLAYFKNTNKPEEYHIYDEKDGLESSYINTFLEDYSGNMWISTNIGISLLNIQKKKFSNYNHHDGVPIGDFMNGSAALTKKGIAYFSSLNGICYFNPLELTTKQQKIAPVQIVECLLFNKQIENNDNETVILTPSVDNEIKLDYNQNSFRIIFSNPDFSQNKQIEYAYMMEGLDDSWYDTKGENQVTFRNIYPGKYKLKIKSRLKNQDWDETNIQTLKLLVNPPLWLTWYAKLFYIIIISIIAFYILRFYKKKVDLSTSLELEKQNSQNRQELNEERLRFYTNITHELRTPLTLILGPLEDLTHDSSLEAVYSKKINIIYGSAKRLLNLINQILEFRKTETQNKKLTVSKENLTDLITEIGLRYKELNQKDNVVIYIDIDNKDMMLYFDHDIITTILNNLLSNALKYTSIGEIRLALHSFLENDIKYVEIIVQDTGLGINSESLPYIFDNYYQAKSQHQISGTGIGLALVKSLAELHEAILHVESSPGKGTTFSLRLLAENTYPNALHSDKIQDIIEDEPENLKDDETDGQSIILIIEDDNDIRKYIASSLENNYRILTAKNGKEGLNLAQIHIPNIIISDIMMPEMDGIELCRKVKQDVRTSHIPVILLTAKDSILDKEQGYDSGADSYLSKPFSARLLQSRIFNLLTSRKKLAELIDLRTKGGFFEEDDSQKNQIKISRLDEEFLNKFTSFIEENIDMEGLDINFLKEKMNMSHSTLYRKIKGLTGITANEFIRKIRLKNSLYLLLTDSYNISEAAYLSGFKDITYFRKCFKEEYGMAPTEYIKHIKK